MTRPAPPPRFALFVDAELPDLALLLAGVPRDGVVVGVARGEDALARMAEALGGLPVPDGGMEEVGILCHGEPGRLAIGCRPLDTPLLLERAAALHAIGGRLRPGGRVRLMGCNVAAGARGRAFGATMARLLGRTVLAATGTLGDGRAEFDAVFDA